LGEGWGEGMRSRKTFLLRISPELYEALEAWAHQELRSVNGQIEYLLKESLARRGRGPHGAAAPDGATADVLPNDAPDDVPSPESPR
jgi:hypothetical protein